jgi:hypothetical protein
MVSVLSDIIMYLTKSYGKIKITAKVKKLWHEKKNKQNTDRKQGRHCREDYPYMQGQEDPYYGCVQHP